MATELVVSRNRSPWREYTGCAEEEAAGLHVAAVPDLDGLERPEHLRAYEVDGRPLLAIDRKRRRVVVNAAHFGDLARVDATRLKAGESATMGRATSAAVRADLRRLALFLVESQLVLVYWHIEARLRLESEDDSPALWRGTFRGTHLYFTNERNEDPVAFSVEIEKATGLVRVAGV